MLEGILDKPEPRIVASATAIQAERVLARRNLLDFVRYTKPDYQAGWIHEEVCAILDAFLKDVAAKNSPRVMIFLPPGTGKTELVSRRLPAFVLGRDPKWEWISGTYGQELADSFGKDVRAIIEEPAYQHLFPGFEIRKDSNAVASWMTTKGGKYFATGVGGPSTGRRCHILGVDDPIKDMQDADSPAKQKECWEWFNSVASTRLYPGGGVLFTQTPWSLNDTSQRLLEAAKHHSDAEQWIVYKFPMIAEHDERRRKKGEVLHAERYSLKEMLRKRATFYANGDSRTWHSLYQCNPIPAEGLLYRRENLKCYTPGKIPSEAIDYMTTDFAIGKGKDNDHTVLCIWSVASGGAIYLKAMRRFKGGPQEITEAMCDMIVQHRPAMYGIEKTHQSDTIGPYLHQRMREKNAFCSSWEITPHKNKKARNTSFHGRAQQGMVYFPDDSTTHDIIIPEFLLFTGSGNDKSDDIVDNASMLGLMLNDIITPAPVAPVKDTTIPVRSKAWYDARTPKAAADLDATRHIPARVGRGTRQTVDRHSLIR